MKRIKSYPLNFTISDIKRHCKSKRKYLKQYKTKLQYDLSKTKWFQIFYRHYLNVKIDSIETQISHFNSEIKKYGKYVL